MLEDKSERSYSYILTGYWQPYITLCYTLGYCPNHIELNIQKDSAVVVMVKAIANCEVIKKIGV